MSKQHTRFWAMFALLAGLGLAAAACSSSDDGGTTPDPDLPPAVAKLALSIDGELLLEVSASGVTAGSAAQISGLYGDAVDLIEVTPLDAADNEFSPEDFALFALSVVEGSGTTGDIEVFPGGDALGFRVAAFDEGDSSLELILDYDGTELFRSASIPVDVPETPPGIAGVPVNPNHPLRIFAGTGFAAAGGEDIDPRTCELFSPVDLSQAPWGTIYIVDWNNHRLRQVDDSGLISTCVGTGELGDAIDAAADVIKLNHPTHVSFAPDGAVIFSAWHNSKVMRWDRSTDLVTTVAGTGARQFGGDGGPANEAILDLPVSTAFDSDGNLLIGDKANHCIRRVEAAGVADGTGIITTIYGQPREWGYEGDGGPASDAFFHGPTGQSAPPAWRMFMASDGKLYLADTANHAVRMIDTNGIVTTIAGGERGYEGDGGPATAAKLNFPCDVDMDSFGNLYIADTWNNAVRVVDTDGNIHTVIGRGGVLEGGNSEEGVAANDHKLYWPFGIMVDDQDNLYVADTNNHKVHVLYSTAP